MTHKPASAIRIRKRDRRWFVHCAVHKHLHAEDTFSEAIGWTTRHWSVFHYLPALIPLSSNPTGTGPFVRLGGPTALPVSA